MTFVIYDYCFTLYFVKAELWKNWIHNVLLFKLTIEFVLCLCTSIRRIIVNRYWMFEWPKAYFSLSLLDISLCSDSCNISLK